jgi:hypothetical protein
MFGFSSDCRRSGEILPHAQVPSKHFSVRVGSGDLELATHQVASGAGRVVPDHSGGDRTESSRHCARCAAFCGVCRPLLVCHLLPASRQGTRDFVTPRTTASEADIDSRSALTPPQILRRPPYGREAICCGRKAIRRMRPEALRSVVFLQGIKPFLRFQPGVPCGSSRPSHPPSQ